MRRYETAGCAVSEVLLPRPGVDLQKWAIVACDQFTSQPEYWQDVERLVGDSPSTLKLIYPEVFLGEPTAEQRVTAIRASMQQYLDSGVLVPQDGLVYVERTVGGDKVRKGLVLCLDLEHYDYSAGSNSLIRATEGTIVERLPPRIAIREGAPLELPHIMVLIDDPENTVMGPLSERRDDLLSVYDVELMMGSGHLSGYLVEDRGTEEGVMAALSRLADCERFATKYGLDGSEHAVLLYAMGDGNHSLATAKAIWERNKETADDPDTVMESPSRHALVELVNVYDEALLFEPIHRVLFEVSSGRDPVEEMARSLGDRFTIEEAESVEDLVERVDIVEDGRHRIGVLREDRVEVATVSSPSANLPVGTLQVHLDTFMKDGGAREIDYVHGTETVSDLGRRPGNIGFYLPAMSKHDLFKSVILDGALPRKTFSMGEAEEKRFYFECRKL